MLVRSVRVSDVAHADGRKGNLTRRRLNCVLPGKWTRERTMDVEGTGLQGAGTESCLEQPSCLCRNSRNVPDYIIKIINGKKNQFYLGEIILSERIIKLNLWN